MRQINRLPLENSTNIAFGIYRKRLFDFLIFTRRVALVLLFVFSIAVLSDFRLAGLISIVALISELLNLPSLRNYISRVKESIVASETDEQFLRSTERSSQGIEWFVEKFLSPIDVIGRLIFGSLWQTLYLSIQDAIALSWLVQIPNVFAQYIIGKEFSSFAACSQESYLSTSFYACFIIITSDFALWIVLAGRILARFLANTSELVKNSREQSESHRERLTFRNRVERELENKEVNARKLFRAAKHSIKMQLLWVLIILTGGVAILFITQGIF
jgi:hypothetical protein